MHRRISKAIYYNRIVYCFANEPWSTSFRFDLDKNQPSTLFWTQELSDRWCKSIIFKENIIIYGYNNRNLLLYSIDIDWFSTIPYEFKASQSKILINTEERLYLIESNGWIYESEIRDEYTWNPIGKSIINYDPGKVYFSYNKGGIYIGINNKYFRHYLKFDLSKKNLIEIAFYNDFIGLKKSDDNLEAIYWCSNNDQSFQIMPDHAAVYIDKGYTLYYIAGELNKIEIYKNKESSTAYFIRGNALRNLDRYLEAIQCYSKAIEWNPEYADAYLKKGITLYDLEENSKAIKCYDKVIELKPSMADAYFNKGIALIDFRHYLDAMHNFNEAIKLDHNHNFILGIT